MEHSFADGVTYSRVPGLDADIFRCSTWRANLTTRFCAGRWREAQKVRGERGDELRLCRQCAIGADHAGEKLIHRATGFGSNICPRCQRGTTRRMVGNRLCISCYNRQREAVIGANGKGTVPAGVLRQLRQVSIGVVLDAGESTERRVVFTEIGLDEGELRRHIERTHEGRVAFFVPRGHYPAWKPAPVRPGSILAATAPVSAGSAAAGNYGHGEPVLGHADSAVADQAMGIAA